MQRTEARALDGVVRSSADLLSAGGKGVNVSRALRLLGWRAVVHCFVAGEVGRIVESLARGEGLDLRALRVPGETRLATIVQSTTSGRSLVVNGRGPHVDAVEWRRFRDTVASRLADGQAASVVICTGSLPPGVSEGAYGDLVRDAGRHGAYTVLDASGSVLAAAVMAGTSLAKINLAEAWELVGRNPADLPASDVTERAGARLIGEMRALGVRDVIVTMGARGLVAAHGGEARAYAGLDVECVNATGAGDALLAGFAAAQADGAGFWASVEAGLRVSAASTEIWQPGDFPPKRLKALSTPRKPLERSWLPISLD